MYYKIDHFIFQRLMAYKLFLAGVDNFLQSSVPVCYLLAADLEIKMLNFERWSRLDRVRCRVNGTNESQLKKTELLQFSKWGRIQTEIQI